MRNRIRTRFKIAAVALASLAVLLPAAAGAQTAGATLTREQKPVYPEGLAKSGRQGNVLLIGRLDTSGKLQDLQAIAATNIGYVDPAIAAVKNWQFKPAMRNGRPVDIAANVVLRFRLEGATRGQIPRPALGDIAIFPANAAGVKSAPDGFPIRRGGDPRLRVEAVLDVPPQPKARRLAARAEAISPAGRPFGLYDGSVDVPANAKDVRIAFSAPVGGAWEDGIWSVQFHVAGQPAGGGQVWIAGDPEHFDFASLMAKSAARAAVELENYVPPVPAAMPAPSAKKPTAKPAPPVGKAPAPRKS